MREINVSRAGDPVHAGDKALSRETPAKRGRVNMYDLCNVNIHVSKFNLWYNMTLRFLTISTPF